MKRPPPSATFKITQMKRVDFLIGALRRLKDDVGTILSLVDEHNTQATSNGNRVIGFWAGLRMILPIIEAVSHVMKTKPQELLEKNLNISTPYLMWDLFRHSLVHGDTLQGGKYRGKTVTWGVGFGLGGHTIVRGHIGIDLPTLYKDLVVFLEKEIGVNDQTLISVETGVEYGTRGIPKQEIIDDFSKLYDLYKL